MMPFAELLAQSTFSFLRGTSQPEEMVSASCEKGLTALGLCDRNGLYGAVRAHVQARQQGVKLIVGAELTFAPAGVRVTRYDESKIASRVAEPIADSVPTLTLLAHNNSGYQNLCRILSLSHAGLPKGEAVTELAHLRLCNSDLSAIVAVPGMELSALSAPTRCPHTTLPNAILDWETVRTLKEIFDGNLLLGIYRRMDGLDPAREQWVTRFSSSLQIPVVASAKPLFHSAQRQSLTDVVYCIRNGITLQKAADRLQINAEARLRSGDEIMKLFKQQPDWVERTVEVAERCHFNFNDIHYEFPCTLPEGLSADERLAQLTWEGAARRYPQGVPSAVDEQIKKELAIITQLKVSPYFLSTFEVVEIARERQILCQGRGSAANSAVCYALGLTAVDPTRSNLLFERFISVERQEPPDIDVDFEHERREEVIQEIYRRHGRERAAMVSEVICYRGKSALREVGKVFGLSVEQVNRLSSTLSYWDSAEEAQGRLRSLGLDQNSEQMMRVLHLARDLQGIPRHLSIHVGGFVLSARPLYEVAPVEPGRKEGRTVIPWDKDDLEALGFFKIDVLGLGMLTAVRKALALIHEQGGLPQLEQQLGQQLKQGEEEFNPLDVIARVPGEDPMAYAFACEADTIGVFQIESRAQMAMLPRLRPRCFYDLVIEVALVRPGPIQGGMVHPYLRRRNGEEEVSPPHPDLWPILERTLGVPLFQEQVMQLAIVGAGYSGGEADQLRRDMAAWKKTGRLLLHREKLLQGFKQKGIAQEFAERLFEQIKGFGDYGFPESHAASFALLAYISLWLKARFPAHFACALLNSQPMGFYSPRVLVSDAAQHGVTVKPMHINHSDWDCTLENGALRLGLRLLKSLSQSTAEQIVAARQQGVFTDLDDFVWRTRIPSNQQEALAEAGAFEGLIQSRRQALWGIRAPRVAGLFTGVVAQEAAIRLRPMDKMETLMVDYQRTGISIADHPVRHLRSQLAKRKVMPACDLKNIENGAQVSVAGLVQARQRPGTASGVVFITLEDETGVSNLVLFSSIFERYRPIAQHAMLILAKGRLELQVTPMKPGEIGEATPVIHVIVQELERLELPGGKMAITSRDFH